MFQGHVVHGVRYGGKAPPRAYYPDFDSPAEVLSLDFSPFDLPIFLVSHCARQRFSEPQRCSTGASPTVCERGFNPYAAVN